MRSIAFSVALSTLAVCACGDARRPLPTTPSAILPTPSPEPRPPAPAPPRLLETPIEFGQSDTFTVTSDDPVCGARPYQYHCRYFRVTAPRDGVMVVTIRWKIPEEYPFDMAVFGPSGGVADGQIGVGLERIARGRVSGGSTYVIEVWSFLTTSEPFDLSTSFEQR